MGAACYELVARKVKDGVRTPLGRRSNCGTEALGADRSLGRCGWGGRVPGS